MIYLICCSCSNCYFRMLKLGFSVCLNWNFVKVCNNDFNLQCVVCMHLAHSHTHTHTQPHTHAHTNTCNTHVIILNTLQTSAIVITEMSTFLIYPILFFKIRYHFLQFFDISKSYLELIDTPLEASRDTWWGRVIVF